MPGISQKFPPDKRNDTLPKLESTGPLAGALISPVTGDVTVSAISRRQRGIAAFIWDALGFLDIIDQQQVALLQDAAAQDSLLAETQREFEEVQSQIQSLSGKLDTLTNFFGVVIPNWSTRSEVDTGTGGLLSGFTSPSASSLGLIAQIIVKPQDGALSGQVFSINPSPGTLVPRGSTVEVVVNDDFRSGLLV